MRRNHAPTLRRPAGPAPQAPGPRSATRLVAPGLAMIAVTYGLARYAYGLFVPQMRQTFDLSPSLLGVIGAGSYAGYCLAIVVALVLTARTGPRRMVAAAGLLAVVGMALVAAAPTPGVLAAGILLAGSSTGLASPPMGAAVAMRLPAHWHDRANALINSGTSVGVALSGPAALLVIGHWRAAWAAFALLGIAVLVWNARAMPRGTRKAGPASAPAGGTAQPPPLTPRYLLGWHSATLLAVAGGVGFASAAYWTFSRDLVVQAGGLTETGSTLFWTVIGVAGLAGGAAGDLVARLGLGRALKAAMLTMGAAGALLAAAPGVLALSYLSAALFGAAYITLTGIVLVWSVAVFPERPSAGLGAGFLMIAAGQVVGSPVAGALAGAVGLPATFAAFSALALLLAWIRPGRPGRDSGRTVGHGPHRAVDLLGGDEVVR